MSGAARRKAVRTYRARLTQRGFERFEVKARANDRDLIRLLAKRLAEEGPEAEAVRNAVKVAVAGEPAPAGGILAALRRSPLVGAELDLSRSRETGRRVEL
ncbi:MAG: hypothetical protein EA356_03330 [Geminicoccaceae bacterium]|nr:MAG: hypothetical protein EA356_03330 [Geminicoccaceae bacterium]